MITFHFYGLFIGLGILAAYIVAFFRKKYYGLTNEDLDNLFLLAIPLGIIGARIYHVADKWGYYSQHLNQIIAVWNGGMGIYGGVVGGAVGILIFLKIKSKIYNLKSKISAKKANSQSLIAILDFLMPSLAIGQAIGRWGNYFNHEVFGPPTNLPWRWFIPENLRPDFWKNFSYFHPTFAYESLWALTGFVILIISELSLRGGAPLSGATTWQSLANARKISNESRDSSSALPDRNDNKKIGLLTSFYAIWYGTGRFFLEFLRFDTAEIGGVKTAQIISVGLIVFGVWMVRRSISRRLI